MNGMTEQERVALWLAAVVSEEAERLEEAGVNRKAAVQLATFRAITLAGRDDLEDVRDIGPRLVALRGGEA